jgi:hypothetical protein
LHELKTGVDRDEYARMKIKIRRESAIWECG